MAQGVGFGGLGFGVEIWGGGVVVVRLAFMRLGCRMM